jgi:hypothetical protein
MKRVLKTISLLSIVGILYFIASCDTIGQPAEGKSVDTLYVIDKDTVYAIDTTNPKIHIATGEFNLNDPYFIGILPNGSPKFRYPIDSIKPNDIVIVFTSSCTSHDNDTTRLYDNGYVIGYDIIYSKYYWATFHCSLYVDIPNWVRWYWKILIIEN